MKIRLVAILSSLPLLLGVFAATHAAAPKSGSICSKLNLKQVTAGYEYTCIKSGKKLVWSKGVKVSQSNPVNSSTSSQNNSASNNSAPATTVTEGWLCDANGPQSGKTAAGDTLYCTLGSDGKSSWRPLKSNSNNTASGNGSGSPSSNNQSNTSNSLTFGSTCTTANSLVVDLTGTTLICRNGKYGYPISTDAPATPTGGWTSRPSWYPSLSQAINDLTAPATSCRASSLTFTSPVVPLDQLAATIPYGAMIYDHVTPIDHAYLGIKVLAKSPSTVTDSDFVPVTAPADGVITELSTLGNSTKTLRVVIRHDCNLYTVYMVLNKVSGVLANYASQLKSDTNVRPMVAIKAGQEFGQQRDNPLDFNTFDGNSWLSGFVNPFAYVTGDAWKPYTTDYLQYFTPSIRQAMTDQLQKKGSTTSGKIDWDVSGTSSGNWFLSGTNGYGGILDSVYLSATSPVHNNTPGKNAYSWSHLSISPHEVDNSKWIFSAGWFTDPNGDFKQFMLVIEGNSPAPDRLTMANGLVSYRLVTTSPTEPNGSPQRIDGSKAPWAVGYTLNQGQTVGVVGIQVNNDGTLSIEINTSMSSASQFTTFTSAKRSYHR